MAWRLHTIYGFNHFATQNGRSRGNSNSNARLIYTGSSGVGMGGGDLLKLELAIARLSGE